MWLLIGSGFVSIEPSCYTFTQFAPGAIPFDWRWAHRLCPEPIGLISRFKACFFSTGG
jgi:hypothetical protein